MNVPDDIAECIQKHLDGELSEAEARRLAAWLEERGENIDTFLAQVDVDASVREWTAKKDGHIAAVKSPRPARSLVIGDAGSVPSRTFWTRWMPLAAAAVVVCVGLGVLVSGRATRNELVLAIQDVRGEVSVCRMDAKKPTAKGDVVRKGDRVLVGEGTVTLAYRDGTQLQLEKHSDLVVGRLTAYGLEMSQGNLTARVTPRSADRLMRITTSHAQVDVIGTTLNVLSEKTFSRVAVQEGRVSVCRPGETNVIFVNAGYKAVATPGAELEARPVGSPDSVRPIRGIIETFEGDEFHKEVLVGKGEKTKLEVAPTTQAKVGRGALSATYDVPSDGWAWFGLHVWPAQDWTGYTHLTFWFSGEGNGKAVRLELLERHGPANKGGLGYSFPDNRKGWRQIDVPFSDFRPDVGGIPVASDSHRLDPASIVQFGMFVHGKGTIRVDEVRLVTK